MGIRIASSHNAAEIEDRGGMEKFHIYAFLVLILFFFQGTRVMAARICVRGEPMADCTEQKCNDLCEKKYGGDPTLRGGARGHCVVAGTCSCTFECYPPAAKFH
ncbi:hypothetical protein SADUNF_Sadunf06G0135700 [Salix dunnii]|uniref:Defensin-like protein n=1 Tax=Salix dunnii TaxID=1413687 RepID=A0A835MVM8_9ROSI|nr:hypothetical protein SADUNF_Sadunf06G0135700 [Salix dunnii]